ncbi:hypothetical protein QUF70_18420 [Desulfobacterales bacterium HSG17]|nr:hypothetical protein [Desulfobacterales bacterium HSG17]
MAKYRNTIKKYDFILQKAYQYTKKINSDIPVRFHMESLNIKTLEKWEETWKPFYRKNMPGNWDWFEIYRKYKTHSAKFFHVSLWSQETLCAMAIGKPSSGNHFCKLYYMAAAPFSHPLKGYVTLLVTDTLKAYAILINSDALRLMNPDENLIGKKFYERFGFHLREHRKIKKRCGRNEFEVFRGERYYEMFL